MGRKTHVATQMLLETGTSHWELVTDAVTEAVDEVLAGRLSSFMIEAESGARIDGHASEWGGLRLRASGNDTLPTDNHLTVRDERAVLAVGFSASSASWGSFVWDWTGPVDAAAVASGVVRTMRDIYKTAPEVVQLHVTL